MTTNENQTHPPNKAASCDGCVHLGALRCIHGTTYFCRHTAAPRRTPADDSVAAKIHAYFGVTAADPRLLPVTRSQPTWCPGYEAAPVGAFEAFLKDNP